MRPAFCLRLHDSIAAKSSQKLNINYIAAR